jgi:hypothetical protein
VPDGQTVGFRDAARAVAGFGLEGRRDAGPILVADVDWPSFTGRLWGEKLTGLAVAAERAGTLPLSSEQTDDLLERHRRAMAWSLRIEQRLLDLDARLVGAGIPYAVLKGPAMAHTAYEDPSLRGFGDLDVLVRGRDFGRACLVLGEMGFRRNIPEPRPGFDERFGKAATHSHEGDSMEIDLHRTLVLGPFGLWIDPEALLDRAVTFTLAGREIPRLDETGMLLNVAMHAALGWPPALLPLRDVLQVSRAPGVDWSALADMASRWRLSAVLAHAFQTAEDTLGAPAPPEASALSNHRTTPGQMRALRNYLEARRGVGGTAVSTLRAIPRLRDKAAYVRALAFPQRTFMDDRYRNGSRSSYGRRLMMPGRWAWRRLAAVRSKEP